MKYFVCRCGYCNATIILHKNELEIYDDKWYNVAFAVNCCSNPDLGYGSQSIELIEVEGRVGLVLQEEN